MINRHDKSCGINNYSRTFEPYSRTCDCGFDAGDPHFYKKTLAVLDGLEAGFDKCKHHETFTRRVTKFFEAALPGYYVTVVPSTGGFASWPKVEVRGNGLRYDDTVSITLYSTPEEKRGEPEATWQDRFRYFLNLRREQTEKAIETMRHEDSVLAGFEKLNALVMMARSEAAELAPSPSYDLSQAFPLLFKTIS